MMLPRSLPVVGFGFAVVHRPARAADAAPEAAESAREIPVAYDVDVVVVGGSTGAVSAAVAAARTAPRCFWRHRDPYLGDDMTATLAACGWNRARPPTSRLATQIFADRRRPQPIPTGSPSPTSRRPSAGTHDDTDRPPLTDGHGATRPRERAVRRGCHHHADAGRPGRRRGPRHGLRPRHDRGAELPRRERRNRTSDRQQRWSRPGPSDNGRADERPDA